MTMDPTPDTAAQVPPGQEQEAGPQLVEKPDDPLARDWNKKIAASKEHWKWYHQLVKHNREVVAGFDKKKKPGEKGFHKFRANLIQGTISSLMPNIYARNPEISVTGNYASRDLKLLCHTIEKVTNRQLTDAKLKKRAKATVKAALTCSLGILKVMYQRDKKEDPAIKSRIEDTQDNIEEVERLMLAINDPLQRSDLEVEKRKLEETMSALREKVEIVAAEGMVIDRVMSDMLLMDDAVTEFDDYVDADWLAQIIPMRKSSAEGQYKVKLDGAATYRGMADSDSASSGKVFAGRDTSKSDPMICVVEIWDKRSQRVYTIAEGCNFFLRDPYSPKAVGERWYPFFILPFQTVDGHVVAPSLVCLTEQLQEEHNDTRDKENAHRDLIKPGWYADKGEVKQKDMETFTHAQFGEVTLLDCNGKPIEQVIRPKQHPAIDPALYDTSKVRYDWEQVTNLQDAARSSVVQPKTATEASIMQQNLSGKVSEFRDSVEDFMQEISQYATQIELMELTEVQVERIMGPHKIGPLTRQEINPLTGQKTEVPVIDPSTGQPMEGVTEPSYDWPQLSRDEIFDMVQLQIRAGTTGEPDKLDQQETWLKLLPAIQPLIGQIMQIQATGGDAQPFINLLKETIVRFDEKLDVEQFIPKAPAMPAMPQGIPGNVTPLQAA